VVRVVPGDGLDQLQAVRAIVVDDAGCGERGPRIGLSQGERERRLRRGLDSLDVCRLHDVRSANMMSW